jgi:8-oxo-dGTP pyrophosphatase MutT (NUDIX family)
LTVLDPPDHPSILHVYSVTLWKGEPVVQNDEHTEIRWFELEQAECLSNLATPQYREIFELLRDASLNLNGN